MKKILFLLLSLTIFAQCIKVTASERLAEPVNVPPVIEGYQSEEERINSPAFKNFQWRSQLIEELPESLHSCIPDNIVKGKLWSIFSNNDKEYYYLIGLVSRADNNTVMFRTVGDSCSVLTPLQSQAERFSMLSYVDEEIVFPMIKAQLEIIAQELGGVEVLKQQLFDCYSVMDFYHHVPIEELLMSEQLGIYYTDKFTGIIVVTPNGNYPLAEFRKMQ